MHRRGERCPILTLIYAISHVGLHLTRECEKGEAVPNCSRNGNDLVLAAICVLTRHSRRNCGRVAVVGKQNFSMSLARCSRSRLADVLTFHDMAAYQLTSSSIDFAVLYELKIHIVTLKCERTEFAAVWFELEKLRSWEPSGKTVPCKWAELL
jgi:hypothetical protein